MDIATYTAVFSEGIVYNQYNVIISNPIREFSVEHSKCYMRVGVYKCPGGFKESFSLAGNFFGCGYAANKHGVVHLTEKALVVSCFKEAIKMFERESNTCNAEQKRFLTILTAKYKTLANDTGTTL